MLTPLQRATRGRRIGNRGRSIASDEPSDLPPEEIVRRITRQIMLNFLSGTRMREIIYGQGENAYIFGPSHPWTQRIQQHGHVTRVMDSIKRNVKDYCRIQENTIPQRPILLSGRNGFSLNRLNIIQNFLLFESDISNWLTLGYYGHENAYIFGSFRIRWRLFQPRCLHNHSHASALFIANDTLRLESATRIPMTRVSLFADSPLGHTGMPFSNIPILWWWIKVYSEPYTS